MKQSRWRSAAAVCAVVTATCGVQAAEPASFVRNGGFEQTATIPGLPAAGGKYGGWLLKGSALAPADWTLSGYFTGELTVLADGARQGKHCLRIRAGAERQAHIYQACPEVRANRPYQASLCYRGGPVEIKAYEYSPGGGGPHIETVATGEATDGLASAWRTVQAEYFAPDTVTSVTLVAAVETGQVADIDDFRVQECPPEALPAGAGWINVLHYGASGSKFETTATATAGSKQIVVKDVGDFKVGQGVTVSRCNIRIVSPRIWDAEQPYRSQQPMGDALEIRGYDGSTSSWLVFILEIDSAQPLSFRWSDSLVHEGKWQGTKVPITWDWQKLSNGVEVRFKRRDLQQGHMLTFSARDQLSSVIEKIQGKTLTLRDAANRAASDALVRHNDSAAIQKAVDRALRQKRNVFFPAGWYRVPAGITVRGAAAVRLEGASGVDTVMDISDGSASVFSFSNCTEITLRNFRMIGHTGMAESAGAFRLSHGRASFWACALKPCNAVGMMATERVLIENVHASRMASECFYAWGTARKSTGEQKQYQKSLTYLRCSVTDCAANAFNNNDMGENTSVLYCRIDSAGPGGWHAAEMPARFLRLVGNYVRNAGPFTIGDMSHRTDDLHRLGCGQAMVVDNVFEGIGKCGGIAVNHGSSQVVIANNLFINYNGRAIHASSYTVDTSFPSNTVTIRGNIIDMTYSGEKPASRVGIEVSASNTIVADNQIYVRGRVDPLVTGIVVGEPAINVTVHNNLIRNCQQGLVTRRASASVTEVVDAATFLQRGLPLEWKDSHRYRGWNVAWLTGSRPQTLSVIEAFDPVTLRLKLREPRKMKPGDRFQVFPRDSANWNLHDNMVTGCRKPVVLDSYGSEGSLVRGNLITRGEAEGVTAAVEVRGTFKLIGNHIQGFDGRGSSALSLAADPLGRTAKSVIRDNIFQRCAAVVPEAQKPLWDAAKPEGNVLVECGDRGKDRPEATK